MKKYIRQNGRDDSALRSSRRLVPKIHLVHDSAFQKATNQIQYLSVRYPLGHSIEERFMRNRVVTLFNVQIDYPNLTLRQILLHLRARRLHASPRAESMTVVQKFRFEDRLDHAAAGFLHHSIPHRRQSQRPQLFATRLWDVLPPNRTWLVPAPAQLLPQFLQFRFHLVRKFRDGDAIHSRSLLALLSRNPMVNPVPGRLQTCRSDCLVIQRIPLASGSSKRADRCLHGFRPHGVAGRIPAEDVFRFPHPVFVVRGLNSPPCILRSHLNSCVPFPRTSFAFSSSFCRPVLHPQRFGTMDALTPLPTGLPACAWPHRFGLRRFAPTLGLGPALAHWSPVRHLRHVPAIHLREVSWVHRLASSEPRSPAQSGGVRDGVVPSPRPGWGLPHGGQLGHAFPSTLSTGSTSRLTAQFFVSWPTAPSLTGTHCHSTTSPVGLRRGLDFNQLEAGITPRHPPLLCKEGNMPA